MNCGRMFELDETTGKPKTDVQGNIIFENVVLDCDKGKNDANYFMRCMIELS